MNLRVLLACVVLLLGAAVPACAAEAEGDILGFWWSPQKDAKIELFLDASGSLAGRLIALPQKSANDVDTQNPDAALRGRRLLGLVIFGGFRQEAKNRWVDGKAYDPESGGTFSARIWLEDADRAMIHGYLVIPLFGRTATFQRVSGAAPRRRQPGEPELVHLDKAEN